jgi:Protein of unknown function (DUF3300)
MPFRQCGRRRRRAGNLESNSQEKVTTQGQKIVIEPTAPDVVYVPQYDLWLVYGAPIGIWPGWYPYPGLYVGVPGISFGLGFGVGFFGGFGWGFHNWRYNWHGGGIVYNHNSYISHSTRELSDQRIVVELRWPEVARFRLVHLVRQQVRS